jgi:superfamily II DNA/RNA helicase
MIEYENADELIEDQIQSTNVIVNNRKPVSNFYRKGGKDNESREIPDHMQIKNEFEIKAQSIVEKQTKVTLKGIDVYFPFSPYECQQKYMSEVIQALKDSQNALLESPTGTGKTLSLLCSALAWMYKERKMTVTNNQNPNKPPKIIYTSRTHSQLSQVQGELKNTVWKPRTVMIASRDHLCVNSAVNMQKGFSLNAACKSMQKGINPCIYYRNKDNAQK